MKLIFFRLNLLVNFNQRKNEEYQTELTNSKSLTANSIDTRHLSSHTSSPHEVQVDYNQDPFTPNSLARCLAYPSPCNQQVDDHLIDLNALTQKNSILYSPWKLENYDA